ncbi:hypothetical protein [Streptosporangium roseum]|uniref:hypothetical protein n=1 Tax=Streptosporangium roseum TaxID=2001 RepID=UPI0033343BBF
MAVGPGLFALVLAASAFASGPFDAPAVQPGSALTGLLLGFTALPAALMLLSLPLVIAYHRLARAVSPQGDS